ncbi:MinD-like ATPase involved in chromosome partitioning or flagellar assembly [Paraburkholderia sp. GAS38]|uniref:KGGVGR-motif variant AAA ATPase n=1 Tax=Paraburkholderia sp. GAS38 TaxID=3035133 RepID=UPI003D1F665E
MHVVTFYSFKGGVGRSMALVNVAAELAKLGRKVLIVDFDLEAPGLRSFNFQSVVPTCPGIVEYVSTYIETQVAPDVQNYVYQAHSFPETDGSIWLMPAGLEDSGYEQRFASINWETLYAERDGYLLMEDLRSQWELTLRPDYVLIDSRTGFTDVAGICTRQLPNAVCLVFTPNQQNLFGLKEICAGIERQRQTPGLRHPRIHFVASNVPNLDDENEVLSRTLEEFRKDLNYAKLAATIHHYNSLALVDQSIFVLDHPKSQLSRQYGHLATAIARSNPEDKRSAISFLQAVSRDYPEGREGLRASDVEVRIEEILSCLGEDNEVLFWLSRVYRSAGKWDVSRVLLERVISNGYPDVRARLDLARIKMHGRWDERDGAITDLASVFDRSESIKVSDLLFAIQLRLEDGRVESREISSSNAINFSSIEDIRYLASELNKDRKTLSISKEILEVALRRDGLSDDERHNLTHALAIALIGLGELASAIKLFEEAGVDASTREITDAFNFAVALYWHGDSRNTALFKRAIELAPSIDEMSDLNRLQCLAFSNWAAGNTAAAHQYLTKANFVARTKFHPFIFSCWSYRDVQWANYIRDLDDLNDLFLGENKIPPFLIV